MSVNTVKITGSFQFWDTRKVLSTACLAGAAAIYASSLKDKPEALKTALTFIAEKPLECAAGLATFAFLPEAYKTVKFFAYDHPTVGCMALSSAATAAFMKFGLPLLAKA